MRFDGEQNPAAHTVLLHDPRNFRFAKHQANLMLDDHTPLAYTLSTPTAYRLGWGAAAQWLYSSRHLFSRDVTELLPDDEYAELLLIYRKNEQDDLSPDQLRSLKRVMEAIWQ